MAPKQQLNAPELDRLKKKVYHAQNREDIILQSFFIGKKKGFYVDIGAYDPDVDSVTKLFYKSGWSGINIEPQTDRLKAFKKKRPRDINLNMGVAAKNSTMILRSYKNQGLSTFNEKIKEDYIEQSKKGEYDFSYSETGTREYTDIEVEVKTLDAIFSKHNITQIDFMKIDVEGFEYEVLKGNDWAKYRPAVLCVEADNITIDWRPLLNAKKYKFVFDDGLNEYYVDTTLQTPPSFDYINHVILDLEGGVRFDHFSTFKNKVNELLAKQDDIQAQLDAKQKEATLLTRRLSATDAKLQKREQEITSPRFLTRRFLGAIKHRIKRKLKQ